MKSTLDGTRLSESICCEPNKIYVIGDRGVGKTSLIKRFKGIIKLINKILGEYKEEENSNDSANEKTIGIATSKYKYGNYTITFKDLSDSPNWKFTKIIGEEIEEIKAVIAMFSLNSRSSFEYVKLLIEFLLKENTSNNLQIILVGNKSDLLESSESLEIISKEEIMKYLESIPTCFYFVISCKDDINIKQVINCLSNLELDKPVEDEKQKSQVRKKNRGENSCLIY